MDERPLAASHLALADPQEDRRPPARQAPLGDAGQDIQAIQFLHAQRERSVHPGTVPEKRTSLLWRNRTFALWVYRRTSDFRRYVALARERPLISAIGTGRTAAASARSLDVADFTVFTVAKTAPRAESLRVAAQQADGGSGAYF